MSAIRPCSCPPARPQPPRTRRTRSLAPVPVADRVDERVLVGVAILAEQVPVVPLAHERRRQARVIGVRSCPAEQVAVEDKDAHQREPPLVSPASGRSRRALR